MAAENFDACFEHVLGSEGGFQNDPNDKGNWTGCSCGSGTNKGTNWGISACSYPEQDIRNLTQDDAKVIYREDYWDKAQCDQLPYGVDLCTFDGGVNSGVSRGVKWLQEAVGADEDGVVGPETLTLTMEADDDQTIDRMCDARLDYLQGLSTWDNYGKGWTNRVESVRATAHQMVSEEPPYPPPGPEPVEQRTVFKLTMVGVGPFTVTIEEDGDDV